MFWKMVRWGLFLWAVQSFSLQILIQDGMDKPTCRIQFKRNNHIYD